MGYESILFLVTAIVEWTFGFFSKHKMKMNTSLIPYQNLLIGVIVAIVEWIITKDFGYFTIDPKTGQRKITMEDFSPEDPEALSVSLKELFSKAYSQDKMPEIISPTIKFEGKNFGEYEVGKTVTPGYRFYNANPGSYSFGPETGVAWKDFEATITGTHNKNSYTSTENATESDQIIYFDEIVVLDDTNLTISIENYKFLYMSHLFQVQVFAP